MRIFLFVIGSIISAILLFTFSADESVNRINGVNLVNPPREISINKFNEINRVNAEWVSIIPYGFSRSGEPQVTFDHARQWWGERSTGTIKLIEFAKKNGLKVMLKPHVWVMGEGWTGDFDLSTEELWKEWEESYAKYIMHYARLADSLQVEMICIGTEYRIPAATRPDYWIELVQQLRNVYKGKITYAANWDNYENISWWDQVDFIGIDAYFPLANGSHPSISDIQTGWEPVKSNLSAFSQKWKKPILFTEYGFQSANGSAGRHWEVDKSESNVNIQLQADAYEATFQALESASWWAGGFFWKWHFATRNDRWRGTEWTPQGKPAEHVIAKWYRKMH